jgi:glycopeptide antibiotics resistance protein
MSTQNRTVRTVLWIFLVLCMLVLARYILFKKSPHYYKDFFMGEHHLQLIKIGWRRANLRPFAVISSILRDGVSSKTVIKNIGGNIVGFIPLGILLPLLFSPLRHWWKTTLTIFLISLSFETTQLITGWGMFDVDDLILNTLGGLAGYILYFIGTRVFFPDLVKESVAGHS